MKAVVKKEFGNLARPPIVVVVGHIDHGKTTLLDFIRKTKVAEKETGGITQRIAAYEAEHKGKTITFIDTPGHEAFSAMRVRGAGVADIAVLVVSAEDGVKAQTKEAIAVIQEAGIPFVVAINKIDKPNADTGRTKKDLAENEVLVEEYGGKIPAVEISAKTGQNIDALLDTLLLVAELEELTWDPEKPATGVVIESHTDPRRGKAATLLVRDGQLAKGEFLVVDRAITPIRVIEDFRGKPIDKATAAMPVMVNNLSETAALGEEFLVFAKKSEAEARVMAAATRVEVSQKGEGAEEERPLLHVILKTDVLGSKEAIEHILERLQFKKVGIRILKSETGDIGESDVKTAASGKHAVIVGFRVKIPPVFTELAKAQEVTIIARDIIYELEDDIKKELLKLVPAEIQRVDLGKAKILAIFKKDRNKQIVGGRVLEGVLRKRVHFDVERNKVHIGPGKIIGLQEQRRDVEEVKEGLEFGMLAESNITIADGDILLVFEEEKLPPSLE